MRKRTLKELVAEKGDLELIFKGRRAPLCLILEDIRSVYNVGAIFRSADAAGIEKLYLCGITAYPMRPDLEKPLSAQLNLSHGSTTTTLIS